MVTCEHTDLHAVPLPETDNALSWEFLCGKEGEFCPHEGELQQRAWRTEEDGEVS